MKLTKLNSTATVLIVILIIGVLVGSLNLKTVKAETQVSGIITSDKTWYKANSPYSLTGNILV